MSIGPMNWSAEGDSDNKVTTFKKNISNFETYFRKNYDRFNEFRILCYESSLSQRDRMALTAMQRPTLEANMLPAYVARLLGEFSAQEFGFIATPSDEISEIDDSMQNQQALQQQPQQGAMMQGAQGASNPQSPPPPPPISINSSPEHLKNIKLSEALEKHLNYLINSTDNHDLQYSVMKDLLTGGWSVIEMEIDYPHAMSMTPKIKLSLPEDRTMCGFDAKARLEDKSDGDFAFKKFIMSRSDFELYYPDEDLSSINFESAIENDPWAFRNNDIDVLVVCDYYCKEKTPLDIVKLSTGDVIPLDMYKKLKKEGIQIFKVGDSRRTIIEKIMHYRIIENRIIEERETEFKGLPLVFVRGSGEFLKHASNETMQEHCIPYIYHAKDAQRFKNYTLNSLANEIENVIQHKLMVAQEAYPTQPQWQAAYTDYQNASVLFYKSVYDHNPDMPIPNPVSPIPRMPAPPEIMQAYMESDRTIQNLLGSTDNAARTNDADISGVAIMQAQMQSNPVAMPYITGMSHGLQRVAQMYIDMLPDFIHHYKNLPITTENSKVEKLPLSGELAKKFNYSAGQMHIDIKVGASYAIQKQQSLMMVANLMKMSPPLQQFFSTKGLPYILDNMEGKNIDALKLEVEDWVNTQSAMQAQQAQMSMQQQQAEIQNNPAMIKAQVDQQKLQLDAEKMQKQHQIEMLKLELEHNRLDAELHIASQKNKMDLERARLDHHDKAADRDIKVRDSAHKHVKDAVDTHHKAAEMHHKNAKETLELASNLQQAQAEQELAQQAQQTQQTQGAMQQ